VPELVRQLEARKLGARRLVLAGYRVDGEVAWAAVGTALASREARHLKRLLADKAPTLDPGFGFDAFSLEAVWTEPLGAAQASAQLRHMRAQYIKWCAASPSGWLTWPATSGCRPIILRMDMIAPSSLRAKRGNPAFVPFSVDC
jgi:hypothetical protein